MKLTCCLVVLFIIGVSLCEQVDESKCWQRCKRDIRKDVAQAKVLMEDLRVHAWEKFKADARVWRDMLKKTIRDCTQCYGEEPQMSYPEDLVLPIEGTRDILVCIDDITELFPIIAKLAEDIYDRNHEAISYDLDMFVEGVFKAYDDCENVIWSEHEALQANLLTKSAECSKQKSNLTFNVMKAILYYRMHDYPRFMKHASKCLSIFIQMIEVCSQKDIPDFPDAPFKIPVKMAREEDRLRDLMNHYKKEWQKNGFMIPEN